jgi:hypothetical protein
VCGRSHAPKVTYGTQIPAKLCKSAGYRYEHAEFSSAAGRSESSGKPLKMRWLPQFPIKQELPVIEIVNHLLFD